MEKLTIFLIEITKILKNGEPLPPIVHKNDILRKSTIIPGIAPNLSQITIVIYGLAHNNKKRLKIAL